MSSDIDRVPPTREQMEAMMSLVDSIGEVVNGREYNEVMNALAYMLAHGGVAAGIAKQEFLATIFQQLGEMYDYINDTGESDGDSSIQ